MHTFIGEPVLVEQASSSPEPVRFTWRDEPYEIVTILHSWSDWNFGAGSHTRSWRNRRHRNYYHVRTERGDFELYVDRGVRGERHVWILAQKLAAAPPSDENSPQGESSRGGPT